MNEDDVVEASLLGVDVCAPVVTGTPTGPVSVVLIAATEVADMYLYAKQSVSMRKLS